MRSGPTKRRDWASVEVVQKITKVKAVIEKELVGAAKQDGDKGFGLLIKEERNWV